MNSNTEQSETSETEIYFARANKRINLITASILIVVGSLLIIVQAGAYPPAPHHQIFGNIRNELGHPLTGENTTVILETLAGETIQSPVIDGLQPGVNYALSIPIDSGITADKYKPTALRPTVPFKIKVRIGDQVYLPIEMNGDYSKLGNPSEYTRLDLTLGIDSDGDGLPDAWEQALIDSGKGKTLADINPDDDSDGDGLSNRQEYYTGNYAFDANDGFMLDLVGFNQGRPIVEFTAITGRTYTVHCSTDLKTWSQITFRPENGTDDDSYDQYRPSDIQVIRLELEPDPNAGFCFFKLKSE